MNKKELEELHKRATSNGGLRIIYDYVMDTIFKSKKVKNEE